MNELGSLASEDHIDASVSTHVLPVFSLHLAQYLFICFQFRPVLNLKNDQLEQCVDWLDLSRSEKPLQVAPPV